MFTLEHEIAAVSRVRVHFHCLLVLYAFFCCFFLKLTFENILDFNFSNKKRQCRQYAFDRAVRKIRYTVRIPSCNFDNYFRK